MVVTDQPTPTIFASAADVRAWLEENHATARELWVGYYKKGVDKTSMRYAEEVEEALCFGWIDGVARSFGDYYANRFTPRRKGSRWSAANIARVAKLRQQDRMRPAGLRAFAQRNPAKDIPSAAQRPAGLPSEMEQRLRRDARAWAYWQAEIPSYRRGCVDWILDAKREETRERRLTDLIADSAAGRRVKPYRYFERTVE